MLETIKMIDVEKLEEHPDNPRKALGDLTELIGSIKEYGILQNLTVFPHGDKFMVLMGHRRLAAAKEAGFKKVPCRVVEEPEKKEQITLMLCENMQRSGLTIPEEADGFQMVLDLGGTVKEIVEKTGLSEGTVRNRLNVAKLDREVINNCRFQLSISDYLELQKVSDIEKRNEILREAFNHDNIKYRVREALDSERKTKDSAEIIAKLKALGFQERETKGQTWTTLAMVYFCEKDKEITLKDFHGIDPADPLVTFRKNLWTGIEIIKMTSEEERKKLEAKELKRRENERKKQETLELASKEIKEFILMAFEGKSIVVKDGPENETIKKMREAFLFVSDSVDASDVYNFINGKGSWNHVPDDKMEEFRPKLDKMSTELYLIICRYMKMPEWIGDQKYKESWRRFADDMQRHGFSLTKEAREALE